MMKGWQTIAFIYSFNQYLLGVHDGHCRGLGAGLTEKSKAVNVSTLTGGHFRKGMVGAENKQLNMQTTEIISN